MQDNHFENQASENLRQNTELFPQTAGIQWPVGQFHGFGALIYRPPLYRRKNFPAVVRHRYIFGFSVIFIVL
jgi:hypothetical protein